jgi:amino acid transporter
MPVAGPEEKIMTQQTEQTTPSTGADEALLEKMGYKQELSRRMGAFSNFAISFSIICVLAGGITAFPQALGAGGGISIGLGWPVGALFALLVAAAMSQIASSYPTAGGLYHWSSILGGKGWGWATAWFNFLGLIFVVASVNFGVWDPFFKTLIAPLVGIDPAGLGWGHQTAFIAAITASQALLNHRFPKLTTKLTDISGYLILVLVVVLIGSLLAYSKTPFDFGRLFTYHNYTGAEGSSWPRIENSGLVFLAGLLLTIYTITGFDASAHTSEETHDAARVVPKGIMTSVAWSALFGFLLISTFVLVIPDITEGVKQGLGFFDAVLHILPTPLRIVLGIGIVLVNYLCALAGLTSTSRMGYAFARDGGLPASALLKRVHDTHKTPVAAVWVAATLVVLATLYGGAFVILSTGCAVFLYLSYVMPVAAGIFAEGKTWNHKGPFDLKAFSKPIAILAVLGGLILAVVGSIPPNEKVFYLIVGLSATLAITWWGGVRTRFQGPPKLHVD